MEKNEVGAVYEGAPPLADAAETEKRFGRNAGEDFGDYFRRKFRHRRIFRWLL